MRSPRPAGSFQSFPPLVFACIIGILSSALPARASESVGESLRDTRWTLSLGGGRSGSASFSNDGSLGGVAVTTASSPSLLGRAGLIAVYHYPARPSSVQAASGPVAGALYLSWVAPGNDGTASATRARAYQVRLSTIAANAPALALAAFLAAPGAAGPVPGTAGSVDSVVIAGLEAGASYYLALRALEADGSPGPISFAATGYAAIAQPGLLAPAVPAVAVSSLSVRWSSGTTAEGYNPAGSRYRLEVSTTPGFLTLVRTVETTATQADVAGLEANTEYFSRVAAFGSAAASRASVLGSSWTLALPVDAARVLCGSAAAERRLSFATRPSSPQQLSAFAYAVQASTAADFSGTILSSITTNLALSTLTVSGLAPGATYYFRVATLNGIGAANPIAPVPAPAVLVSGFGVRPLFKQTRLGWEDLGATASACAPPGGYTYEVYRSSVGPSGLELVATTTASAHVDSALKVATTYYYRLAVSTTSGFSVDPSTTVSVFVVSASPLIPAGIVVATHESSATVSWLPVHHFDNQVAFGSPAPPEDLAAYQIFRASAPSGARWALAAEVSSGTLAWVDPAGGPGLYYRLRAANLAFASPDSLVGGGGAAGGGFLPLPDDASYLILPPKAMARLRNGSADTEGAFTIVASSRPEDVAGNVVSSVEIEARTGRGLETPLRELDEMLTLQARFKTSGELVTPSAVAPSKKNLSVYWHNGDKWVQLFGKIDALGETVSVQTKYLGRYQLRTVERSEGVSFDNAGVSNRFLTPNGDGDNDSVVFTFDNPRDSLVSGKIFDRQGRLVADGLPRGPIANSLVWDGKANGRAVESSVYIYMLEGEGKKFTGTVVVIR